MPTELDVTVAPTGIGRVRAWVWVACGNGGCASFGLQRQVYLRRVALGVVEVPHALLCEGCGMSMSFSIWEAEVPKLHVDRDPTYRDQIAQAPTEPASAEPVADAAPAETETPTEAPEAAKTTPRKTQPRKKAS